jgi:large subunit ribosomal protein L17
VRHNVYGKHLGRDTNQRTALFRGLIRSLVLEGSIVTTDSKVKSIKGLVDKLFTKAKKGDNASLNVITKTISQKDVSKKLIELSKNMKDRNSGFTETLKLGMRQGDGAMMVRMNIVGTSKDQGSNEKEAPEKSEEKQKEKIETKKEKK